MSEVHHLFKASLHYIVCSRLDRNLQQELFRIYIQTHVCINRYVYMLCVCVYMRSLPVIMLDTDSIVYICGLTGNLAHKVPWRAAVITLLHTIPSYSPGSWCIEWGLNQACWLVVMFLGFCGCICIPNACQTLLGCLTCDLGWSRDMIHRR